MYAFNASLYRIEGRDSFRYCGQYSVCVVGISFIKMLPLICSHFNFISRSLITGGERQNCPKLSIAGLDLLLVLHTRLQSLISQPTKQSSSTGNSANLSDSKFWISCWRPIIEGMADAANSRYSVSEISIFLSFMMDILDCSCHFPRNYVEYKTTFHSHVSRCSN